MTIDLIGPPPPDDPRSDDAKGRVVVLQSRALRRQANDRPSVAGVALRRCVHEWILGGIVQSVPDA